MVRNKEVWIMWLMVVVMLTNVEGKAEVLHRVGGKRGWTQNINYTEWALHETFYVGDWLYFGFDEHLYNVYQVNKTSYEQCNDHDFIKNITRGGRDVFDLTEAKPFYFLSGGGYCYHGMKLAINVVEFIPSPESAPAPAKNGSPADTGGQIILSIWLAIALVWGLQLEPMCY